MKYTNELKQFLEAYEQYELDILKATQEDTLNILHQWEKPEYWEKYATGTGVATPPPLRIALTRIKHPEKVADKIFRKPDMFPEGLSPASIYRMQDTFGVRVIVYFASQLPLIDKELRSSGLFDISTENPPEAYLSPDQLKRIGLTHIEQKNKESGYSSIHYTVKLKNSSLPPEKRPYYEIQVRTMAQELWSELEHTLAYKPENRTHFSAKRRLQILSREIGAIDEQFNLLYEELMHSQETATYQDEDRLNFENLPKVFLEVGVKCTLVDLNPILKLFRSRGVDTIKDLLLIATPRRLETIRNTYISSLGCTPDSLELSSALAALKGVKSEEVEIERIKSQIEYHQSKII